MNRFKYIRMTKQLKAYEVANKAQITPSYLCLIERGRVPSVMVKRQLAKVMGLPIKTLWPKSLKQEID